MSVGKKNSYKNKFSMVLMIHIIYNFYIQKKDPPRLVIFFDIVNIFNPLNFINLAEDYFKQLFSFDEKNFELEKNYFIIYTKKCITLFIISTLNEIKSILEEQQKNDKKFVKSSIDIISNTYNNNDFFNKKEDEWKEIVLKVNKYSIKI